MPLGTVRKPVAPRQSSRPPRIYGLDSLRAVAVLAVVVYHFMPALLPGGFVGVDVFFVLSGFLITTLLVRERVQTGRVSLRHFWTRRVRRIIPAMVAVVVVGTAAAGVIGGDVLVGIKLQVLGALTFASNWFAIAQGTSYSADLTPQLFANFWSLAVEEQFYLFWPLVLLAVFSVRRSRATGLVVTGLFAVGSAVWMAVAVDPSGDPSRVYFGTDTHLFGLMAGAFFALWFAPRTPREAPDVAETELFAGESLLPVQSRFARWFPPERRRWSRHALGIGSALGLVVLALTMSVDDTFTYRGGLVLASLFSLGLIAFLIRSQPLARRVEVAPLRWVGVRSYGIYLWHWPVVVIVASLMGAENPGRSSSWSVAVVATALTAVAAWVSYKYLERPVMIAGIRALRTRVVGRVRRLLGSVRAERSAPTRSYRARAKLVVVSVAAVGLVAAVVLAGVREPATSSLEAQILEGAAAAQQANELPPAPEPAPAPSADPSADPSGSPSAEPTPEPTGPPPGDQVTVIGDSVSLISVPSLQAALPGVFVDAEVSRQMSTVPEIAAGLRDAGALREYVVVSLGTNSTVTEKTMDDALAAIGPDHRVVLVTGSADRSWIGPTNDQLRAAAERHPGVVVADWQAAVAAQPDVLGKDGVHPGAAGQELYARTVADALARAQAQGVTQP
jgi:peptidoglycan/LPS O-acetylase OafA/YrhL